MNFFHNCAWNSQMTAGKSKSQRNPLLSDWMPEQSIAEPAEEIIVPHKPAPPLDLPAYMAATGRLRSRIGRKRRLKTTNKGANSKVPKAVRARPK
jgi:hypothetical protein